MTFPACLSVLCPFEDVADRLGVPPATSCCCDSARIQRLSNLPQRARTGLLCLSDDGEDVGGESIRFGLHGFHSSLAGDIKTWIAQSDTASLGRREGLPGSRGDECSFLLSQRGEQVQHEGIDVRPQCRSRTPTTAEVRSAYLPRVAASSASSQRADAIR